MKNQVSPYDCHIPLIILFFEELLKTTKNIYGSFNSYRAALSIISSENIGENQDLKRFLKGVFRLRPPEPRYDSTWDPDQVLSLKALSSKLVTLLLLATAQRLQTISLIKYTDIHVSDSGLKI